MCVFILFSLLAAAEIAELQKTGKLPTDDQLDSTKENNTPPVQQQQQQQANYVNLQT